MNKTKYMSEIRSDESVCYFVEVSNSPSHSRNTTPSPSPSPKLGKRAISPQLAQKPGAIDNTPLVYPNAQKVCSNMSVYL